MTILRFVLSLAVKTSLYAVALTAFFALSFMAGQKGTAGERAGTATLMLFGWLLITFVLVVKVRLDLAKLRDPGR